MVIVSHEAVQPSTDLRSDTWSPVIWSQIFWLSKRFHANTSRRLWDNFNGISHHNFMSFAAFVLTRYCLLSIPSHKYRSHLVMMKIFRQSELILHVKWYSSFDNIIPLIEFCKKQKHSFYREFQGRKLNHWRFSITNASKWRIQWQLIFIWVT